MPKHPNSKEAEKYIRLLTEILEELKSYNGVVPPERAKILTKKVIKYKAKINGLK